MINYGFHHKSILLLIVLCCVCICAFNFFSLAAYADDLEDTSEEISSSQPSDPDPIIVEVNTSVDTSDLTLVDFSTSIVNVDASNTTGFKSVVLGLLGEYQLVTKEYTYQNQNGMTSKQVTTESDYPWMITAAIFALVIYCLFRMVGGVLCGRK